MSRQPISASARAFTSCCRNVRFTLPASPLVEQNPHSECRLLYSFNRSNLHHFCPLQRQSASPGRCVRIIKHFLSGNMSGLYHHLSESFVDQVLICPAVPSCSSLFVRLLRCSQFRIQRRSRLCQKLAAASSFVCKNGCFHIHPICSKFLVAWIVPSSSTLPIYLPVS